jgi:acetyltransferase
MAIIRRVALLLQDVVDGGASVGFHAPLSAGTARQYWEGVRTIVEDNVFLWVAEANGVIVGSVQLEFSRKKNANHRAEIQKMLVSRKYREQGVASQLMEAAEIFAAENGRTLLVLDTQVGSKAESIYLHWGWIPVGQIPRYATSSDGTLHATAYFYKQL